LLFELTGVDVLPISVSEITKSELGVSSNPAILILAPEVIVIEPPAPTDIGDIF
jgi:hypothetical protein